MVGAGALAEDYEEGKEKKPMGAGSFFYGGHRIVGQLYVRHTWILLGKLGICSIDLTRPKSPVESQCSSCLDRSWQQVYVQSASLCQKYLGFTSLVK